MNKFKRGSAGRTKDMFGWYSVLCISKRDPSPWYPQIHSFANLQKQKAERESLCDKIAIWVYCVTKNWILDRDDRRMHIRLPDVPKSFFFFFFLWWGILVTS